MNGTTDPLVSTKLRPSRVRPGLVARPRLVDSLTREPGRQLTLLCAPAGFGKTTVLSAWAGGRIGAGHAVAWLSLDRADNDPARFLAYLVAALRSGVNRTIGEGILAALRSNAPFRPEALTAALINELAALPGELDLVLDDYHLIDDEAIHRMVGLLLDHQPAGLHLVVSSRTRPPLRLPRLRARGAMAELAAADLAFTHDESAAFLHDIMGLELSAEHIAELDTATEGWIAGLQLAALSMRNRDDLAGFIASFSGRHRGVFDFLAEEVLAHQPPDVRDFLLETSILDSLAGPLCDAVTGRSDGQAMLEELERANLFIIALDDERRWFRYHHLFADFLRGRLAAEAPTRARERHLRASRWHEAHGHVPEAIGHALAAPDPELGARLIERESPDAWSRGEIPTVLRWLEALPIEVKRHRPRLFLQHALALALTGRPDDAEACVSAAEEAGGQGSDGQFLEGFAAAVRSWCARLRGDARTAIDLARRALALLPAEAGGLRAFAAVCLGDALWTTGDLSAARDALADAAAIGRDAGHVYATISAMTLLARVHAERGHLHAARETLDAAQQLVTQQNAELLPAAGGVHIGVGALQYEHDRLDEAERALRTGIDLAEGTRNVTDLVWGTVVLSRARWARGDTETATALAREAARTAGLYGADLELAIAAAWLTRLHVSQGDLASADAFAMERAATAEGAATAARVLDRIAAARLLHARGRHHEALRLLDGPRRDAEANGRTRDLIEILSLRALVQWATQQRERALSTLTRALALAEPEGYVRVFVDEGQPMATLLSALLRAGRAPGTPLVQHTACARRLLAAMGRAPSPAGAPSATLPAPLTERELDILGMIAAGLTNREIAARTFVSLGTVKTHINNLYRKLGVRSRTQALARARELRLLAP